MRKLDADGPIYLDYNATTPVDPRVVDEMLPYLRNHFGNPSSSHVYGTEPRRAVALARRRVAGLLDAEPDEVIFTGGGTESDALAISGVVRALGRENQHIISQRTEHPAVLEMCRSLERHAASTGSACHSGQSTPSPVLDAMGASAERAMGAVRLSLGRWTTHDEVEASARAIARAAALARDHEVVRAANPQSVGQGPA
jgi:cysteine sulfinate desulfinase/cysteine desulfurase-like protein